MGTGGTLAGIGGGIIPAILNRDIYVVTDAEAIESAGIAMRGGM